MSSANSKPINITSYNCRGLRNPTVSTLLEKCDLILLQETLITKQDLGAINSLSPLFQGTGASPTDASKGIIKGRPQGGVAIIWRKIFSQYINEIELDFDWLIGVSIKFPNCAEFYVFNVYMPFQCNANEEKFLEKLGIIFSIINDLDSPNVFVLGDFNAHLGRVPSRFGDFLLNSCDENDFIVSSRLLLPETSHTYISERWGSNRWLDHCISTQGAHEYIRDFQISYHLSDSDHIPFGFNLFVTEFDYCVNNDSPAWEKHVTWDRFTEDQISSYTAEADQLLREIKIPIEALQCRNFQCCNASHCVQYSEFYKSIITASKQAADPLMELQLRTMRHVVPGCVNSVKIPRRISIEATQTWRESGSPIDDPIEKVTPPPIHICY